MTHVGYFRTPTWLQRSGRGFVPFGSHSTYLIAFAADPNRVFCSPQAGHQKAPYMTAPVSARWRARASRYDASTDEGLPA